ncbi:hypothetical protein AB4Y89_21605 [Terriglobus sp. 2YAB30_2]|uniref:hypothetical protein n=1 Tax=unclassified Terriglobus TaxID=2628988 RepID=UPI003F96BE6B
MTYPKYKYHATEPPIVVHTREEESALGNAWTNSPADHGIITCPSAEQIDATVTPPIANFTPQRRKRRTTQE